jgi:hypothetical protein
MMFNYKMLEKKHENEIQGSREMRKGAGPALT